ncbi:Antigen 1 like protein [Verticillium longisporum]|nr:Antigen 1 like protein [Verticillium longisporum]
MKRLRRLSPLRYCQPEPKLFHDLQSSGPAVTRLLAKMLSLQTAALLLLPLAAASPVARAAETSVTVTVDTAPAGPTSSTYNWAEGWKANFPIHQSCNITLRTQLEVALAETMTLAAHARDHLLHNPKSELATKFFGNQSVAGPIGWYSKVVSTDKSEMLFRCDDPDRNCATQDAWAGHWRGANATQETVICDLSYEIRRPLAALCGGGYTVAESKLNTYWATDLLHRAFHLPGISDGIIDHYAEDYAEALKLAATEPELYIIDSDTLQYFAIEAYAYDIAIPGVGCPGERPVIDTAAATSTAAPTTTAASDASGTTSADASCHTHDDGFVHC